jgi:hypothetical protein
VRLCCAGLPCREDGVQQARKAGVQVVHSQREQAFAAVGAGSNHAGLAQDAEVMRERGLREPELESAARGLVSLREAADDFESGGIAQRVQDAW